MYAEHSAQQTDSLDDLLSEEGTVTVPDVAVASVSAPRMTKAQRMLPKRDRVLLALTERPVAYRAGDKRALYQKQRSALITQVYIALNAGTLDASDSALEAFCRDNWTAPVLDDYDAGTGGPSPRGVILASKQEQLIQGVVEHVFTHYNFSAVQSKRAKARWANAKRVTVNDLLSLPEGLSKKQQAEALGCSTSHIATLRKQIATPGICTPSAVETESMTSADAATPGICTPSATQSYNAMTAKERDYAIMPFDLLDGIDLTESLVTEFRALPNSQKFDLLAAAHRREHTLSDEPFDLFAGIDL